MTLVPTEPAETGGLPVADDGAAMGDLVDRRAQLQYGRLLTGAGTAAKWRSLTGWRDSPSATVADSPRPQSHGDYPGTVYGDALTVTYTYTLEGTPESVLAALAAVELHAPMDGVERALVVDDGAGPTYRMARVIGRSVPELGNEFGGAVECALQFLCADPRRYSVDDTISTVRLASASGGLVYPLTYPLTYGVASSGGVKVTNAGSVDAPFWVSFRGPVTDPMLIGPGWSLGFNIVLADGESLDVDTGSGTALLNGNADRLYTIRRDSDPLELCTLPPGPSNLSMTATAGSGVIVVTHRDARM